MGSFGNSSYSFGSSSFGFDSLDQAFLGVGGVGRSRLLVPGDLMESLELLLTKADLGVFGSEENIDLLESRGVLGREDGPELRS